MNTTHEVKRVAVIGAGPSGMTAALYAARAGFETTIFEKQAPGGQMVNTATIDNFPGHTNTPGFQLAKDMLDTLTSTSANIVYKEVTQISKTTDGFEITTSDQTQPFDYVIFASGISPRRLEVPEYDKFFGRGISTCVICDSSLVKGKPVVIVGGGNSAIEESIYISNIASDVVVINRDAQPIAEESIITAASKISNITIMNSKTIVNVNGQNSIESVTLDDGTVIPTTAVFTYIG
ncbi:MAG: hypothetical protein DRP42_00265 [Tenericutes bacterium]|nr:MAG: hypothetical protein DRP42_00265 [Mycoplasmatota bacterium]